jgi:hypothetical protein
MNHSQLSEPIALLTVFRAHNEVISAELGTEISLLNVTTGVYYTLNDVGASIWRLVLQETTVSQITSNLLEVYDVDEQRCQRDVIRIVQDLHEHGLIVVKSE